MQTEGKKGVSRGKTTGLAAIVAITLVALVAPQSVTLAKEHHHKSKKKHSNSQPAPVVTPVKPPITPPVVQPPVTPVVPPVTPPIVPTPPPTVHTTPALINPWDGTIIYDGYGSVNWDATSGKLTMVPKAATASNETHAALMVSKTSYHQPYKLSFNMKTTAQLRTGSPANAWEVGWVAFGYKDDGKFKYLTLKPNGYGLELGESLLNLKQAFLYTSAFNQDQFPINQDYSVVIGAQNNVITITINGKQYTQYTVGSKDALSVDGKYGFYTEDAAVQFSNIKMQQL
ncbi:MAG: hypothetical protein NT034_02685 [Candidatus Magasanikbacteria bacterium]|nr:hypothetical protein [Candidatus Magasanikbacteria bacterium]